MAYALDPNEPVPDELRRVTVECIDRAIACLRELDRAQSVPGRPIDEGEVERLVHDTRKRCKEARAAARLARPAVGDDAVRVEELIRDVARTLASSRDAAVMRSTLQRLRPDAVGPDGSDPTEVARPEGYADQIWRLTDARAAVQEWDIDDDVAPLVAALDATHRRARSRRWRAADRPSDTRFHAWRTAAKRLWYQLRLIEPAAPELVGPVVAELDALGELLGEDHDLAVLAERALDEPDRYGGQEVASLARLRQQELRHQALDDSGRLADDEGEFLAEIERAWRAARGT